MIDSIVVELILTNPAVKQELHYDNQLSIFRAEVLGFSIFKALVFLRQLKVCVVTTRMRR